MEDLIIGANVTYRKDTQLLGSVEDALRYNCTTLMFYTGAPQNTARFEIDDKLTNKAFELMKENNIDPNNVVVHAPYIINLANNMSIDNFNFACNFLKQEIKRCDKLKMNYLVLHPGSAVKLERNVALQNIVDGLNNVLSESQNVIVCLETMAGKGTELGINFEEIKFILDNVNLKDKIGVCLDTCHLNDAGYDMGKFDEVLDNFDKLIGLSKIKCIHINDSKNEIGAHKDRHENIGYGTIGFDNLIKIIYHDKLKGIPKILETPFVDSETKKRIYPPYKFEIEMIRNKKFNHNLIEDIKKYYK